jgi:hypothetical protein
VDLGVIEGSGGTQTASSPGSRKGLIQNPPGPSSPLSSSMTALVVVVVGAGAGAGVGVWSGLGCNDFRKALRSSSAFYLYMGLNRHTERESKREKSKREKIKRAKAKRDKAKRVKVCMYVCVCV